MNSPLRLLVGLLAATLLSSCYVSPYGSSGYGTFSTSYRSYGYAPPSYIIRTTNSRWGYDPYRRCYYDYHHRHYYNPVTYTYYRTPPHRYKTAHYPKHYRKGYCPAPRYDYRKVKGLPPRHHYHRDRDHRHGDRDDRDRNRGDRRDYDRNRYDRDGRRNETTLTGGSWSGWNNRADRNGDSSRNRGGFDRDQRPNTNPYDRRGGSGSRSDRSDRSNRDSGSRDRGGWMDRNRTTTTASDNDSGSRRDAEVTTAWYKPRESRSSSSDRARIKGPRRGSNKDDD